MLQSPWAGMLFTSGGWWLKLRLVGRRRIRAVGGVPGPRLSALLSHARWHHGTRVKPQPSGTQNGLYCELQEPGQFSVTLQEEDIGYFLTVPSRWNIVRRAAAAEFNAGAQTLKQLRFSQPVIHMPGTPSKPVS